MFHVSKFIKKKNSSLIRTPQHKNVYITSIYESIQLIKTQNIQNHKDSSHVGIDENELVDHAAEEAITSESEIQVFSSINNSKYISMPLWKANVRISGYKQLPESESCNATQTLTFLQ